MSRLSDLQMWYVDTYIIHKDKPYYVEMIDQNAEGNIIVHARRVYIDRRARNVTRLSGEDALNFYCPDPQYIYCPAAGSVWFSRRKRNSFKRGFVPNHWTSLAGETIYKFLCGEDMSYTGHISRQSRGVFVLSKNVVVKVSRGAIFFGLFGGDYIKEEELSTQARNFILSEVGDAYKSLLSERT